MTNGYVNLPNDLTQQIINASLQEITVPGSSERLRKIVETGKPILVEFTISEASVSFTSIVYATSSIEYAVGGAYRISLSFILLAQGNATIVVSQIKDDKILTAFKNL